MIGRVLAIALNTFREAIRSKVLYGIAIAVVGLNLFALVLAEMSLHEEARMARDVGLAGISLFGAVTAIVLGVTLLHGEVQRKTIHNILSKPIERHEFVLGKYLGMSFTLALLVALFALALAGQLALVAHAYPHADVAFDAAVGKAVVLGLFEVLLVAAVAVFFSSFSTPYLAGLFTFGVFFLGRASIEMRLAAQGAKVSTFRHVTAAALRVIPDLHVFAVSGTEVSGKYVSVHGDFVGWGYVGTAAAYGGLWIAVLLVLSMVIFRRRDFT